MANKPPLTVRSVSKGLKSASQLIADSTRSMVEEVMPNMSSTWFSLQTEASNSVNKALAKTNSVINRQHSLVSRTKLGRSIQTSVNKMAQQMGLSDYEGNQLAFELENYSQDFDSDTFTEGADGSGSFENGYGTTENMKALSVMNRNLAANGLATVKSVNNMTKTLANVNLESTKAISSTIENMSIAQTNAISSGMSEVVRQIQITNNYTAAMLDFMNQNISPSNANLVDTMSIIGAKLDEISESLKSTGKSIDKPYSAEPSQMDKVFSDGAGFNVKEYKKAITEAFNETTAGQTLGMLTSALTTFKGSVRSKGVIRGTASTAASPLLKSFIGGAIGGKDTKAMLAEADTNLSKIMQSWLYRLGDMAEDAGANGFQQLIGRMFGIKRTKLKGLDMGAGRKDEVIGWNGVAQTALTQVIPNYLASIEKAISGSTEKKLYDYASGTFKSENELLDDLVKKVVEMNDEAFGETASKIIKALEVQGSSKQDTNELLNAINNIVNVRINEGRGQDAEYTKAIESALTKAGLGTVAQGKIKTELEHSIETMTKSLNAMYERISNESTDHLAYRNIFNNYDKTQRTLADKFMKANKTFINPGMFNSMASWDYDYDREDVGQKFGGVLFDFVEKMGYIDPTASREYFRFLGKGANAFTNAMYAGMVSKDTKNVARNRSTQARQEYHADVNAKEAEIQTATSQADKFEESTEKSLGTNISLDGKMSESKRRSENVKIGEAIASGNTNSILQGLVMSLHNNLIMPMYTDVFSENGMLNKFFGGEDSEWSKLKDKLFGKENGILTPMVDYLKYQFTGKGYKSRSGKIYEDKDDNIWNTIKELYGKGYGDSMTYLFGDEYTQNETYQKFFHFLSPEGIKETKDKIDDYKKRAKLEASYIAKFRDMKDKVLSKELHIDDYTSNMGDIVVDNTGKAHAKGLFKDLIENLEEDAAKRVLERIDKYNKELVEAGYLDSKRYGKLGEGRKFVRNFMNSQNDPRWANIPTGIRSDGSIATMGSSGCGIMSLVYNANARGNMITPMDALRYAQTNGGLTEGQANSNLYTSLGGKQTSAHTAFAAVARGNSAILAGRGLGTGGSGDHIISLLGLDGDTATILDPTYGVPQVVGIDKLKGTKSAFVFGKNNSPLGGASKKRLSNFFKFRKGQGEDTSIPEVIEPEAIIDIVEASEKVEPPKPSPEETKLQLMNEMKVHITDIANSIKIRKDGRSVFTDIYDSFNGTKLSSVNDHINQVTEVLKMLHLRLFGVSVNAELNGKEPAKIGTTNYIIKRDGNRNVVIVPTDTIKDTKPDSFEISQTKIEDMSIETANINVSNATINISETQLRAILDATTTKPIDGRSEEIEPPVQEEDDLEYYFDESGTQRSRKKESEDVPHGLVEDAYRNKEGFADNVKAIEEAYANAAKNAQNLDKITGEAVAEPEDFRKTFMKDLKSYNKKLKGLPNALTKGAIIGGTIGALNMTGAGLLTSLFLPTSLVGGAIAGCGLSLLSKSEKFNDYVFGKKDESGARVGGLINKSQIASFKKAMPYAVGGATIGIVKNIIGGALGMNIGVPGLLGGALLGSNPIGAGIVGLGLGILKNSETFKNTLFGKKGDDGKHSGGFLSKGLDKMTEIVKESSQYTKNGLKGALIGAGAGLTLSNMGFLPAALSVGGPIGAAIAGLGIGIASNSDRFKRYLFGDEYVDEEGKEGRRKNGLIHRTMNKIMDEVIYPIKGMFQDNVEDFAIWAKKNLVLPFKLAFGPIIDSFSTFKDDLKKTIHDAFETLTDGITGILRGGLEKLLTPLTATVRGVAGMTMKAVNFGAKMTGTMASLPLKALALKTHKKRKREDAAYKNAVFDNIEEKWAIDRASGKYKGGIVGSLQMGWDHLKDIAGFGSFADDDINVAMREGWAQGMEGNRRNALGWFEAGAKFRRDNKKYKSDKKKRESFRDAEKLMRKWMREDDHIEDRGWTDELLDERAKALRKLGLLKEGVSSEEDIKQLMYHRGDWQKRFGMYGTENLEVKEAMTREEKAQEATATYQQDMIARADKLIDILSGKSAAHTAEELTAKSERTRVSSNVHYFTKFGLNEQDIENINKFTQGRVEFSKNTVKKFKEYADSYRSTNPDRDFFMSRSIYDDIFEDERNSGTMSGYSENLKEQQAATKEKERLANINNVNLFTALLENGLITKEVCAKLCNEYWDADLSHTQIKEIAIQKTLESLKEHDEYRRVTVNDKGEFVDSSVVSNHKKHGWVGSLIADMMNNDFVNKGKIIDDKGNEIDNKGKEIRVDDWEEWLSNIISNAMIDAEDVIQEEEDKREREEAESRKATEGTNRHYADMELKWYEKFFTKEDGTRNWAGKAVNKAKNSWLGKLISGLGSFGSIVADSPLLQVGLLSGAYIFREQLGSIISGATKVVKDVATEYVPAFFNYMGETVFPFIYQNLSNVVAYAIKSIPEIYQGIKEGFSYLWTDIRSWLGLGGQKTKTYSSAQVNLSTGITDDGQAVAQWFNPSTGEYQYILDKDGNYQVLDDYQYIADDGTIRNIHRGTTKDLLKYGRNVLRNPMTLAAGLRTTGTAVSLLSKPGRLLPVAGKVFKATDNMGKGIRTAGKNLSKYVKETRKYTGKKVGMIGFLGEAAGRKASAIDAELLSKNINFANEDFAKYAATMTDEIIKSGMSSNDAAALYDLVNKYGDDALELLSPDELNNAQAIIDYTKNVQSIANKHGVGVDAITEKASKNLTKTLDDAAEAAIKGASKSVDEVASGTGIKLLDRMLNNIKKIKGSALNKILDNKIIGGFIDKLSSMVDDFKKLGSKVLTKFSNKCTSGLLKSVDDWIPFANVAFAAYDLIKGWANTENLFGVPEGYADPLMKSISAAMNFILGLGIGPIFDIFLTVYSSVTGRNMKQEFAVWVYEFACNLAGNSKALDDLKNAQIVLDQELERYNLDHKGGELTMNEYLDLKEQEDGIVNQVKKFFGSKNAIDTSKYEIKYGTDTDGNIIISSTLAGIDTQGILDALNGITTAVDASTTILSEGLKDSVGDLSVSVTGYGSGALGYGNAFAQTDPSWAKFTLGKFPNGQPATMDLAGCGPTALANVASQMNGAYTPIEVAKMAVKNGYISDGGANARLFNEGANKLGLNSQKIDKNNIIRHLANGEKIIVSGKSDAKGYGNIFTPAGHIVTLEGVRGNDIIVNDPQTGNISAERMSKLSPFITNAWAFSNNELGYGNKDRSILINPVGYGNLKLEDYVDPRMYDPYYKAEKHTYEQYENIAKYKRGEIDITDFYPEKSAQWKSNLFQHYAATNRGNSDIYSKSVNDLIILRNSIRTSSDPGTSTMYTQITNTWNSMTDAEKNTMVSNWKSQPYFHAMYKQFYSKAFVKLMDMNTTNKDIVILALEFDILPEYAKSLTKDDHLVLNHMHGFYNATSSLYDYNIGSLNGVNAALATNYKSDVAKYLAIIEKNPDDFMSYVNIPKDVYPFLADPSAGGKKSLLDNWMYRLMYQQLINEPTMPVSQYSDLLKQIADIIGVKVGSPEYETMTGRPYGILNRMPYYSVKQELWKSLNWAGGSFSSKGHEIASLASILTAYNMFNGNALAITPDFMMSDWFTPDHNTWYTKLGISNSFYSRDGLQSLRETYVNDMPLKITNTTDSKQMLEAMRARKLVLLANTGGNESYKKIFGDSKYVVGTYADDKFFTVMDPTHPGASSYPVLNISDFPMSGISARIFETGDGYGLNENELHSLQTPSIGESQWDQINSESDTGLGILSKIIKAFASMGENILKMIIGNTKYESIFKKKMDENVAGEVDENILGKFDYLLDANNSFSTNSGSPVLSMDTTTSAMKNDPRYAAPTITSAMKNDPRYASASYTSMYMNKLTDPLGLKNPKLPGTTAINLISDTSVSAMKNDPRYSASGSNNTSQTTPVTNITPATQVIDYTKPATATDSLGTRILKGIANWSLGGSDRFINPWYGVGYGYGGEDDEVSFDLNTIEGVLGNVEHIFSKHLGSYIMGTKAEDVVIGSTGDTSSNTSVDNTSVGTQYQFKADPTAKIEYGDRKSAKGLVTFAKSMMKVGCRYVWGGSCKKMTESYRDQLQRSFGDDRARNGKPAYYQEKYNIARGGYVSDCSGLIRGYTGGTNHTAANLYTGCTRRGAVSKSGIANLLLKTPGMLVFRQSKETNKMVHVGILVGDGNVIDIADYIPSAASDVKIQPFSPSKWTHWGEAGCLDYSNKPVESKVDTATGKPNLPTLPNKSIASKPVYESSMLGFDSRRTAFSPVAIMKGGENDLLNTRMSVDQYVKALGYGPGREVDYLLNTLGGRITQRVGLGVDPSTGALTRHRGTDIAALYNSPIHSPVSGTVIENRGEAYGSDYGNYVVVKDGRGKKHLIAHMNEASGYGVGSHINTGDILGFVGSSGKSTGPHVHYEIRERDHIIDPLEYGKVTRHTLGLNNKSKINMIERKLDETMTKHGSPVGGDDDFITTLNTALKSDSADHIVDTLHEIVSILTGWSSMDADSKNRILDAMENVSENSNNLMNISSTNTTVNNNTSNTSNRVNTNSGSSPSRTKEIESKGGRSLHELIARKNSYV